MSCLVPDSGFTFGSMFFCIGQMLFGDITFAGLFFLLILGYMFWRLGLPISASVPMGVLVLFVLGSATWGIGGAFTNLLWLIIIAVAVLFTMAILSYARR